MIRKITKLNKYNLTNILKMPDEFNPYTWYSEKVFTIGGNKVRLHINWYDDWKSVWIGDEVGGTVLASFSTGQGISNKKIVECVASILRLK